jgi:hypothetical protein
VVNPFLIRFSAYFSDRIFAIIENFDPRFDVYPNCYPNKIRSPKILSAIYL